MIFGFPASGGMDDFGKHVAITMAIMAAMFGGLVYFLWSSNARVDRYLDDIRWGEPVWEVRCGSEKFQAQGVSTGRHGTIIYGKGDEQIARFSPDVTCAAYRLRSTPRK